MPNTGRDREVLADSIESLFSLFPTRCLPFPYPLLSPFLLFLILSYLRLTHFVPLTTLLI
jgi:hypothetical protein